MVALLNTGLETKCIWVSAKLWWIYCLISDRYLIQSLNVQYILKRLSWSMRCYLPKFNLKKEKPEGWGRRVWIRMVYIWGLLCYVMFLLLKLEVAINLICCCAKIPRNSEKFNWFYFFWSSLAFASAQRQAPWQHMLAHRLWQWAHIISSFILYVHIWYIYISKWIFE